MVLTVEFNEQDKADKKEVDIKAQMLASFYSCLKEYIPNLSKEAGTIKIVFINGENYTYTAKIFLEGCNTSLKSKIDEAIDLCAGFLKQP